MPEIFALSERAVTIVFGNSIDESIHRKVMMFSEMLALHPFNGLVEIVTAYVTVTVYYNPVDVLKNSNDTSPYNIVRNHVAQLVSTDFDSTQATGGNVISIPVCYDEEFALDLNWLSGFHKVSQEEIIREHSLGEYTVFMIGFTPGFPYMGILPERLDTPRKQTPRTSVPAGSVGIAGRQTGIYPFNTPGGWQIIGRTPLHLFSLHEKQPSLLKAGDRVKFVPISKAEFYQPVS